MTGKNEFSQQKSDAPMGKPQKLPAGFRDILPFDHEYYTYIKKVVRHRCRQGGFRRISTPVLEYADIFHKGLQSSELPQNIYTVKDPVGEELVLKPEGLLGVVRAFLQHKMYKWPQPVELFYLEPHFRFEPENSGHYRQFWQFGVAVLGEEDESLMAQVMQLAFKIIQDLGLEAIANLEINSIGCKDCQPAFLGHLKDFYFGKERSLCQDCIGRLDVWPLSVFNCQEEDCKILAELAPKIEDSLCKECKTRMELLEGYLHELDIKYNKNPRVVRTLSYYNQSVFEFWNEGNKLCGGGRADYLIKSLGGREDVPVVSFAMGMEQLVKAMKKEKIKVPSKDALHVFVAQLGDEAKRKCLTLVDKLREAGIKTVGALGKSSMQQQIELAVKFEVPFMLIMGISEVRDGTAILREMKMGTQKIIPFEKVVEELKQRLGEEKLDKYTPGEILY